MNPLILVVEDEEGVATSLKNIISGTKKYDVITVDSAEKALKELKKNNLLWGMGGNRIQLILLDINLPGMNGLQFLQKLQKNHPFDEPGVIMVTACDEKEKWMEALSKFVVGYIEKPFEAKELLAAIDRFFSDQDRRFKMVTDTLKKYHEKEEKEPPNPPEIP